MAGAHHAREPGRTWHEFRGELPPRPNARTGEPFPPPGRGYAGNDGGRPEFDRTRSTKLSHKPTPPDGRGPVLAWFRHSRLDKLYLFLGAVLVLTLGIAIVEMLQGHGLFSLFTDARVWPVWLVVVLVAYWMASPFDYSTVSAGADWLKYEHNRRWYHRRGSELSGYIKTYELVELGSSAVGHGEPELRMKDNDDNGIRLPLVELQQDRRIWDLLYNGILHSVANGCEINTAAISLLELESTPVLTLRASRLSADEPDNNQRRQDVASYGDHSREDRLRDSPYTPPPDDERFFGNSPL